MTKEKSFLQRFAAFFTNINNKFNSFFGKRPLVVYGLLAIMVLGAGYYAYRKYFQLPALEKEASNKYFKVYDMFKNDSFAVLLKGSKTMPGLKTLASKYAGTKVGMQYCYMCGVSLMQTGKYKEALEYLEDVDFDDKLVDPIAKGAAADCYSQLGKYDKAASLYRKAATMNENDLVNPYFLKKAGLCYEKSKDNAAALEVYNIIKSKYKNSEIAIDIDKYIGRVGAATGNLN